MAIIWQANVFTIFPGAFPGSLGVSIAGKALAQQKWRLNLIDLKKFPVKSDRIDSIPYGGGAGMVLSPLAFEQAFDFLPENEKKWRKIYFSPRGRALTQDDLSSISRSDGVLMLCGRYEGVDQRIIDFYKMEEVSLGDFILLGGEVAAMAIIEGCVRLLPGVVGNCTSICDDSFKNQLLEHDQYTRPEFFHGLSVPALLLKGNHAQISQFRLNQSKSLTRRRRFDLWARYVNIFLKNCRD
ncbi:MAG: tRNA (guanosine(37)-N1)-methyltransferase TrmD [Holosporaceae bacterium]|jgi:tRNA (guanine37-N1)-methyltransferase|nr:tRNA (guanosine(37)-N1)-methyltransferase TrmD [Holosporaceae bacterium]